MYLVSIDIKLINSDDSEDFSSFNVYRIVNTTGMYNKDYLIYKTKDFSELKYNLNVSINPSINIKDVDLTPTGDYISAPDLECRLVSVSSMYSISGDLSFEIDTDNNFGDLIYSKNVVKDVSVEKEGLSIDVINELDPDDIIMNNDCIYLGTSSDLKEDLESEMKKKYNKKDEEESNKEDAPIRKTSPLSSIDVEGFNISPDLTFKINGEVRRGIYFPDKGTRKEAVDCYVLVPAVSSVEEFNNYVSCRVKGYPNNMLDNGDNNDKNLYPSGTVGMLSSDTRYRISVLENKANNIDLSEGIPGHPWVKDVYGDKYTGVNDAFSDDKVNGYNSWGYKHPICVMLPDSREDTHAKVGTTSYFSSVWLDNISRERTSTTVKGEEYSYTPNSSSGIGEIWNSAMCSNYMMFLWNSADSELYQNYTFLNFGSMVADRMPNGATTIRGIGFNNSADNESPLIAADENTYGTSGSYFLGRRVNNLTSMDILYNLLNSLYIAQWRTNNISTTVVDLNSIVYHGLFDSKFELDIKYNIKVDKDTLITFGKDSTPLNETEVKSYIFSKTAPSDIDKIMESIKNNVTINTNIETSLDNNFKLNYSVGKSIDLTKQYSKILQMSTEGYRPGKQDVYINESISTLDSDNNPIRLDTVYVKDEGNIKPYSGTIKYPNGIVGITNPDYFKIMSGYDRKKPAMIVINPKNGGTQLWKYGDAADGDNLTTIYLDEVIYYNNKIWDNNT